jgi:hypothetical protein
MLNYNIESNTNGLRLHHVNDNSHKCLELYWLEHETGDELGSLFEDIQEMVSQSLEGGNIAKSFEKLCRDYQLSPRAKYILHSFFSSIETHESLYLNELNAIKSRLIGDTAEYDLMTSQNAAAIEYLAEIFPMLKFMTQDTHIEDELLCELYQKSKVSAEIMKLLGKEKLLNLQNKNEMMTALLSYYNKLNTVCNFGDETMPTIDPRKEIDEETNQVTNKFNAKAFNKIIFAGEAHVAIDVTSLFSKEAQKVFTALYGKTWKEDITIVLKDIENNINFGAIDNGFDFAQNLIHLNEIQKNQERIKYSIEKDSNMLLFKRDKRLIEQILDVFSNSMGKHLNRIRKDLSGDLIDPNLYKGLELKEMKFIRNDVISARGAVRSRG